MRCGIVIFFNHFHHFINVFLLLSRVVFTEYFPGCGGLTGVGLLVGLFKLVNVTVINEVLLSVVTAAISNTHLSLSTEW